MKFVADMHTHTLASDHAYSTISENAASAAKAGLSYLGMTDHCINMEDSPHIWHFCNMGVIPHFLSGVRIIKGVEADLTGYNGELDINDDIYYNVEWINASMHNPCIIPGTAEQHTNAYIKVMDNPKVCVLGHTESADYPYDYDAVTKACKEKNVAMEFNVSRFRSQTSVQRLHDIILPTCAKNGCYVIVDSDAHFCDKIGAFKKAEALLKDIDFPEELIVNADLERFENFLRLREIKTNAEIEPDED